MKEQDVNVEKPKLPEEIERKFLVSKLPETLGSYPFEEIIQGYIDLPGVTLRFRQEGEKYFQTIKSGPKEKTVELEMLITKNQFEQFWDLTKGIRLSKTRYKVHEGGFEADLDIYKDNLGEFLTVEVEFSSKAERDVFIPPDWFGKEITFDYRYSNFSLAKFGLPTTKKEHKEAVTNVPSFELEDGVAELVKRVKEKSENQPVTIVAVAGGSASGKTTAVAAKLVEVFGDEAVIISMDDYSKGNKALEEMRAGGQVVNWDHPEYVNLFLLRSHLADLKNGVSIEKPIYSFISGEPDTSVMVDAKKVIIVEGLFALNEAVDQADFKAFVDIGLHGRIFRRLMRDVTRTEQKPLDILSYFANVVEPMHKIYVESTKKNADLIIVNEYQPTEESEKANNYQSHIKFKSEIDREMLRKLGAQRLITVNQIDSYYNPPDKDLILSGEMVRVRAEGRKKILTYKGPKKIGTNNRPFFEFEIDEDTARSFLGIYGNEVKTVVKARTLFFYKNILFSLDQVRGLGDFVEVRVTEGMDNDFLTSWLKEIGLDEKDAIITSYQEM